MCIDGPSGDKFQSQTLIFHEMGESTRRTRLMLGERRKKKSKKSLQQRLKETKKAKQRWKMIKRARHEKILLVDLNHAYFHLNLVDKKLIIASSRTRKEDTGVPLQLII